MPTISQLAKIMVPDETNHSLKIRFDKEKAVLVLKNLDRLLADMNLASCEEFSQKKTAMTTFLQYVKRYARPDGNKVIFSTKRKSSDKGGWGRLTPDRGRGYVSLPKSFRHFLAYNLYSDHDIVNCHPVILRQLMDTYDMETAGRLVDKWNRHRENYFLRMIQQSRLETPPSRDDCKKISYCFLYDGNIKYQFEKLHLDIPSSNDKDHPLYTIYYTAMSISNHVRTLRNHIKTDFGDIWDSLPYDKKKHNPDAGRFSAFIQHIERAIMLVCADVAVKRGYEVGDYCHDGIFLSEVGVPADVDPDYYTDAQDEVRSRLGFDITLVQKDMDILPFFQPLQDSLDGLPEVFDQTKVDAAIPDDGDLDLNKLKNCLFANFTDNEKQAVIDAVMARYVIRVEDKWFIVNKENGIWYHEKPYTSQSLNNAVCGTILFGQESNQNIPIKSRLVFKDPANVLPNEHNVYYKNLPYKRENVSPLSDDELSLIEPWLFHQLTIMCRDDKVSFDFLINVFRSKLLEPFKVGYRSRCLVLFGIEGCGKTTPITKLFEKLFGKPFVNGAVQFKSATKTDGFTNGLEHKLVVIMNEVPEYDHNHSGMFENFKAMITDNHRRSRQMFMGERSVENTIFYIATTNNRNAFKISPNDRRYFMLDVSPDKASDIHYHARLLKCIDEHYQLIARYILTASISTVDVIPETSLRQHGRDLSIGTVGHFLQYLVSTGWDPDTYDGKIMGFYYQFKEWCKAENRRCLSKTKFYGRLMDKYHFDKTSISDDAGRKYLGYKISNIELFKKSIRWDNII